MRTAGIVLVLASLSGCASDGKVATGASETPSASETPYDFAPGARGCAELIEDPGYIRGGAGTMYDPETDRVWVEGDDGPYLIDPEDPACQQDRILDIRNQQIARARRDAADECASMQGDGPPEQLRGQDVDPEAWEAYRDDVCARATRSP